MKKKVCYALILLLILAGTLASAQNIKAGTGRKVITPPLPFWLTGYAARTQPAAEKVHDLWAKALLIETPGGGRAVIVTTDVLGLSPEISNRAIDVIHQKYGLGKSQVLLNSSHTHSGPMIWPALGMIADFDSSSIKAFSKYNDQLVACIVDVVDMAIKDLSPAKLFSAHGMATFAKNRRQYTSKGVVNGINPTGSVDHDVPVLKVEKPDGSVKAVLFGYACHNTTVTGANYLINGDYAGFAQVELEKIYPGATALFFTGCAGDQNPQPRGTLELAETHGKTLAASVKAALQGNLQNVTGPVVCSTLNADLKFQPYSLQQYQSDLQGSNPYLQRRAKLMIEAFNRGWDISNCSYPVQAIRFGKGLTILSLAGEVVVDYSLKVKKQYPKENLFVAGYCHHVTFYVPTKKILEEGGYEAVENLIYYGMPGPFAPNVESKIFTAISRVMKAVGAKP